MASALVTNAVRAVGFAASTSNGASLPLFQPPTEIRTFTPLA